MSSRSTFPSAPQLPQKPSAASYEKACRLILSQRFRQVLWKAFCLAAVVVPVSTLSLRGGLLYILFTNSSHFILAFIFGILPTLLARKLRRQASPGPRPKTLAAEIVSIPPLYQGLHMFSGAALAFLYATFVGMHVSGIKLSLFTGSHRHPWSLNERHLMLVLGNSLLGLVYSSWNAVKGRNPSWLRRFGGLTQRAQAATRDSAAWSCRFALGYWISFGILYFLLRVPFWGSFNFVFGFATGPFLHFVTRPGAYWQLLSLTLYFRMFVLQFSSLMMWDIAGALFEINASQVIHLSQFREDPNASLIAGLQSKNDYFKYFAFAELANVVTNRQPRRVGLFSDLKANPTAWEQVCRECLLLLGKDYSTVTNRNTPSAAAPAPAPAPLALTKPSQISKDSVYKATPATSSGPLDTFVGAANAVATVVPTNLSVPAIFLSSSHPQPTTSIPIPRPSSLQGWKLPKLDLSGMVNMLPPNVAFWLRRGWVTLFVERETAKLEALLPNRAADVWAIEALSVLVTHSLQEDPYGRVQRDIPRVLEALISYLGALEQLIEEANVSPTPNTEDVIKKVVQPVANALREGIRMIVLEFGPRLTAFTFPPRIAKRLQTMVDYL
ncbi:hypothetical protein FRC09_004258 [Ceratobasidium sp. 395]|nr:hypothetical protein FRC09_004258 [Ceratobasidium sp. 395]